jgi:SAM-dependent methyltransferase
MNRDQNYLEINRSSWNKRTEYHLKSEFYDIEGFLAGKTSLKEIELSKLGNIEGKSILHLQCHFGQDSISLGRLGATVTGVDLSDKAIERANELTVKTGIDARFICSDIYDLPNHLSDQFDIVYTTYGTIGWLPDMDRWGKIINRFLKPSGRLIFVEFHPVVWMFDDYFQKISNSYFNQGAIVETENGTYADRNATISGEYVMWNHGLGEVFTALIENDLEIENLEEYDYSPHSCFLETDEFESGKFRIKHFDNKIPMVYAITAKKK